MKNMFIKVKDFLIGQEDEYEDELEEIPAPKEVESRVRPMHIAPAPSKVLPLTNPNQGKMEILNFTMTKYDMTGEIGNYIKNRKTVIVNMQQLDAGEIQRAVDYLTGTCCALNGTVEKVAEHIFIFAPDFVNVSPDNGRPKEAWPKA